MDNNYRTGKNIYIHPENIKKGIKFRKGSIRFINYTISDRSKESRSI